MAYQPKSYRKYLAGAAAAAVVVSAVPVAGFAAAQTFTDASDIPAYAVDAVNYLVGKKAINGYEDGSFKPAAQITRGEVATILAKTLNLTVDDKAQANFDDTDGHWSSKFIAAVQAQKPGVLNGDGNGKFRPNANITREELASVLVQAYGLKLDTNADVAFSDVSGWGANSVNILASLGVAAGKTTTTFAPKADVTRAETAAFFHRAEVETVRVEVKQKVVAPAVESVSAINAKELVVKFTKAIENVDAIEEAGNRVVVYTAANNQTDPDFTSTVTTFSEDKKTATVILTNNKTATELEAGKTYTVALVDNNNTPVLAKVVMASQPTELVKGLDVPTATTDADQDKYVITFAKKMNSAAATNTNYTVYDSSNNVVSSAISAATFVDSTTKKEVRVTVAPGALKAGKSYTVIANTTNVKGDDGTLLTTAQSKFTINTPSLDTAKPTVSSAQVTGNNTIVLNFNQELKTGSVDTDLITVKKSDGTVVPLTSANFSGKTLTITQTGTDFEAGKKYTVEVAPSVAINNVYRNATSDAISTTVTAASNVAATKVSAQFVRQAADKENYDLVLAFDQPVTAFTTNSATDIKVNTVGDTYQLKDSTTDVVAYTKDTTGKSLVIKDAQAAFEISGGGDFVPEIGKTYQVEIATGKIVTSTPASSPKSNTAALKADVADYDVSAPEIDNVTLASAEKITVQFDETIDAAALKAGDVTVQGYTLAVNGTASAVSPLSGANGI